MHKANPFLAVMFSVLCIVSITDARSDYEGLNLSTSDITQLASVGVTPQYVQQIRALGYADISTNDITQLFVVGVKPDYIKQVKELGYDDISVSDITQLSAVGVKPDYIRKIKALGYHDISINDIVQWYVTGVTPAYIKQMKETGISNTKTMGAIPPIPPIPAISEIPPIPPIPAISHDHNLVIVHKSGSFVSKTFTWFNAFMASLIVGAIFIFVNRHSKNKTFFSKSNSADNLDTRLNTFEQRVNDLQDILLSIDDRLDRRLKRST